MKLQLTSDSTEKVTSTGRGETVPYMDWNSEFKAAQKCTFSHLSFLLLALFYAENRKEEETKELDCLISVFPSSPLPYARIFCVKSFTKIIPHNSFFPQPFLRFCLSASAVLEMWLLQSLTVPFCMAEHGTYCALSIQSNRNTELQGYLTQHQSNEIIVPLSHQMALALGWQFYLMKNMS